MIMIMENDDDDDDHHHHHHHHHYYSTLWQFRSANGRTVRPVQRLRPFQKNCRPWQRLVFPLFPPKKKKTWIIHALVSWCLWLFMVFSWYSIDTICIDVPFKNVLRVTRGGGNTWIPTLSLLGADELGEHGGTTCGNATRQSQKTSDVKWSDVMARPY